MDVTRVSRGTGRFRVSVPLVKRRFTVAEYHRMRQAGILAEDDRVELIDGEIVEIAPIGSRHAACVNRLNRLLSRAADRAVISVQNPVRLDQHSEPQPDLALLLPRQDFYASGHPGPEDVVMVVEVAEASAAPDREVKVPHYGKAGIREAWLVDLQGEVVEVYRQPSSEGYREVRRCRRGDAIAPQAFPDVVLTVDEILA